METDTDMLSLMKAQADDNGVAVYGMILGTQQRTLFENRADGFFLVLNIGCVESKDLTSFFFFSPHSYFLNNSK